MKLRVVDASRTSKVRVELAKCESNLRAANCESNQQIANRTGKGASDSEVPKLKPLVNPLPTQPYLPGSAKQYAHDARGGSKDVETLTGLFKDKPYPPGSTHCPRVTFAEGWPCYTDIQINR